jgi:hypothetical protein
MSQGRPACTAAPGMPQTTEVASSCTISDATGADDVLGTAVPVAAHAGHDHRQHVRPVWISEIERNIGSTAGRQ